MDKSGDCWLWLGRVVHSWTGVQPFIQVGKGRMNADRAMWLAVTGKKVPKAAWLGRTCGQAMCINPAHLFIENAALRRAKERLKELERQSKEVHKQVMETLR